MKSRLEALLASVVAIVSPLQGVLYTIIILVLVDLLSGIIASIKRGEPITSSGLKRTVVKLALYLSSVILASLVGIYLTGPSVPVLQIVTSMIGLAEIKSVLENFNAISGSNIFSAINSALTQRDPQDGEDSSEGK